MRHVLVAALLALGSVGSAGAAETVKIANIEWPPYSDSSLPGGGAVSAIIKKAFAGVGVDVVYDFVPFNRAVALGTADPAYIGYTTEYRSPEVEKRCALSNSVGRSPVGFVKKTGSAFAWNTLDDVANFTVGVVDGYVNDGGEFDAAIASGKIKAEAVKDDLTVLRKIAAGRNPIGVVDANVLAYLTNIQKDLAGALTMDKHLLKEHDLLVCFRNDATGAAARDRFNQGLAKLDIQAEYTAYFAANFH